MIKLKCSCGATTEIVKKLDCDERHAVEIWLIRHKPCQTGAMAAEIESRDRRITELEEELEEAWKPNRCRDAIAAHNRRGNKT